MVCDYSGLPEGPAHLCFNKEVFMKGDFNVDEFVVECRRRVPLDRLRDDLHTYLKILQTAMIELINKDYADFVNLSTNLVGLDKSIAKLMNPLEQLKQEVQDVKDVMADTRHKFCTLSEKQNQLHKRKESLQRLASIIKSVEKIELLLGVKETDDKPFSYGNLTGQMMERVANEFNFLQFNVNKSLSSKVVEQMRPRIANITSLLQYHLEHSFRNGLLNGQVDILRQCLRTYAVIDKRKEAESLFQQCVVKPYMEENISEDTLSDNPNGLKGFYSIILDFIPTHYKQINEALGKNSTSGSDFIQGYDFMVNSVWPEIISNIEARTPSIFAPGNPDVFHKKYKQTMEFISNFEHFCGSQSCVSRLRSTTSYSTFHMKWSLSVYFQIRFQEIAGSLEAALLSEPFALAKESSKFFLNVTNVLWNCIHRCWDENVYLDALGHRFWKLTLQHFSRFSTWINDVLSKELLVDNKMKLGETEPESGAVKCIDMKVVLCIIKDAKELSLQLMPFYTEDINPRLANFDSKNSALFEDCIKEAALGITEKLHLYENYIVDELTSNCIIHLKSVNDIPRLYRRTNREIPSKASTYVSSLFVPLTKFMTDYADILKNDVLKLSLITQVAINIATQYGTITNDVLTSVRKMEESLKRLKKSKSNSSTANNTVTDDDKIRQQILIDVHDFNSKLVEMGVDVSKIESILQLENVVEQSIAVAKKSQDTVANPIRSSASMPSNINKANSQLNSIDKL